MRAIAYLSAIDAAAQELDCQLKVPYSLADRSSTVQTYCPCKRGRHLDEFLAGLHPIRLNPESLY